MLCPEDDKLVKAMRAQNQDALGRVIDKYTAYVGTIVWNIVRDKLTKADAEEILSEVFCLLWYSADKVQPGKLKSFLSVIARRRALNALRTGKREVPLEEDAAYLPISGPEEQSIHREEYAAIQKALEEMPEPDRSIFIWHYYYGRTTADIARVMALNVNTVQSKLRRGREMLRRKLMEGGHFIG